MYDIFDITLVIAEIYTIHLSNTSSRTFCTTSSPSLPPNTFTPNTHNHMRARNRVFGNYTQTHALAHQNTNTMSSLAVRAGAGAGEFPNPMRYPVA